MTNNDVLRRLRYALNLPDGLGLKMLSLGGAEVPESDWKAWLRKEEEPGYQACQDSSLMAFLDGLILLRRGPKPGEPSAAEASRLTNNLILKKLRVALSWQEADLLAVVAAGGMTVSRNELSALFRKPGQKNFKPCGDQLLRAVLTGMVGQGRPQAEAGS